MYKIVLTNHQNTALSKIKNFLSNDSSQIFILKGYAGTGKTYLIKEIVNYLKSEFTNSHIAAPTGRASRMLKERTDLDATTIHKLIYNQSSIDIGDDEETDDLLFNFVVKNNNQESINDVYIFDESSMISDRKSNDEEFLRFGSGRLLFDLLEFVGFNTTVNIPNLKRKIIFIGDPAQLPPIGNNFSFALSMEYLIDEYDLSVEEYTLKEVVRQSETSGVLSAASKIRDSIEKQEYNRFNINNDVKIINDGSQLKEAWSKNLNDSIFITYSNEQALKANIYIRNNFITADEGEILPDEKLIVVANNYNFGLMNGDFVNTVKICSPVEHTIDLRGREKPIKLTFRETTIRYFGENNVALERDVLILDNLIWSEQRNLNRDELVALRVLAAKILDVKFPSNVLKKTNPTRYKIEKDIYIDELKKSKYYNALQVKFGYAVTCHKAQGGEWDNVFVKFDGFNSTHNESFYRWAYTAITRAKENLYAMNPPSFSPWSNLESQAVTKSEVVEKLDEFVEESINIPNTITEVIPKNIYLKVLSVIKNEKIEIVESEEQSWKLRIIFKYEDELVHVDFNYNKKGKISVNIFQCLNAESNEMLSKLFSNISQVSSFEKRNIDDSFTDLFLKEFYLLMKESFSKTDIEIADIEHILYGEKYYFKNNTDFCKIVFNYDSKKSFSKTGPRVEQSSDTVFENKCLKIIAKGISE